MTQQAVRFEGVVVTDRYLTVYLTIGDRLAKRVREVKVPVSALLDADVVPMVNAEAARRLKTLWEAQQVELPWS